MKILLINPNTSTHVTDRMVDQARKTAGDRAEIVGVTAQFGPAFISSRAGNAIATHAALDLAARHHSGHDAIVLGVSMDTGLIPIRELFDMPVVGMAESAMLLGCTLGQRIGCLTLGSHLLPLYEEVTAGYGLSSRVVWRALELPAAYGTGMVDAVAQAIAAASERMAREDGVDVVALCGAVLTGYADTIQNEVSVPVVDCIDAAIRTAILLVERAAALNKPPALRVMQAKANSIGLGAELAALLGG